MDGACHVMGCHLTQHTRVRNAFDDVATTIYRAIHAGNQAQVVMCVAAMYVGSPCFRPRCDGAGDWKQLNEFNDYENDVEGFGVRGDGVRADGTRAACVKQAQVLTAADWKRLNTLMNRRTLLRASDFGVTGESCQDARGLCMSNVGDGVRADGEVDACRYIWGEAQDTTALVIDDVFVY